MSLKLRFLIPILAASIAPSIVSASTVSGASALEFARRAVAFGPRPAGSEANHALQNYIVAQLKLDGCGAGAAAHGCELIDDSFTATTPRGAIAMKNIIARFPGKAPGAATKPAIALTGHFDTKYFPGRNFVGASDGGSSTGLLLELAKVIAKEPHNGDIYVVFFDGEEAFGEWTDTDSVYGSRHLAERWRKDGTGARLRALINLDMIGDKSLDIRREMNSNAGLRKLFWSTASDLGYGAYFPSEQISTDDDHMPFIRAGVPSIDIIDFDYPPWHTDADTMDKISAQSLEIVGNVTLEVVHRLERQ